MKKRLLIAVSIGLNLFMVFIFGKMILDRGGLPYLVDRFNSAKAFESQIRPKRETVPPSDRRDIFEVLPKTKGGIVFLGDSLTSPCEWVELFGDIRVKNRGLGGDTTNDLLLRLDNILMSQPLKIFIMVGTNDLEQNVSPETIVENYTKIIQTIRKKSADTEVYIQSILPVTKERQTTSLTNKSIIRLNSRLNHLASELDVTYVDLFSLFATSDNELNAAYSTDGLHLSGEGYLMWKSAIDPYLADGKPLCEG